ncbi:MAG TPA: lytic murein transglycosylase [Acidisoma sp.]|jgi:membrane-bound lytic murein transglycosylase B|nr:lytic murein transglycosylase [Acidisoma sp.]
MRRRSLLHAIPAASAALLLGSGDVAVAASGSFQSFLVAIDRQAAARGISYATRRAALYGLQPNADVIRLDNYQPEFTQTWAQYSAKRLSQARIAAGRQNYAAYNQVLAAIRSEYGVDPGVILGIWGLETNYGSYTGGFSVVQALATLGWSSHRPSYFRSELIAALTILNGGAISPQGMTGSYAGAMGQPQFMPSVYLKLAVSFSGQGRPNIWTSVPDSLASIANYLRVSGWRQGLPWGEAVVLGPTVDAPAIDPDQAMPLSQWLAMGVRRIPGHPDVPASLPARLIQPDGAGGAAFLAYPNYRAIRRYNPSDFYALSVGLLGNRVTA